MSATLLEPVEGLAGDAPYSGGSPGFSRAGLAGTAPPRTDWSETRASRSRRRFGLRDDQGIDIGSATSVERTLPIAVGRWSSRRAFGVSQGLIRGDGQADLGLR